MPEPDGVEVAPNVIIPLSELSIRAITGSGPGGQHVNRSATRIELRWNARDTKALSAAQRARVASKLSSRLDGEGWLRIVAGEYRSQAQNRRAAFERLGAVVGRALVVAPVRRPTKPTRASVARRLDDKRRRSEQKKHRRKDGDD